MGWSRGRWAGVWLLTLAAQAALGTQLAAAWSVSSGTVQACVAGLVLVQVLKMFAATRRLADLGRPPDDAMWSMVPIANLLLAVSLLAASPKAELRERRTRSWSSQRTAIGAWREGLRAAVPVLPVTVLAGLAVGWLVSTADVWLRDHVVPSLIDPSNNGLRQGIWAVAGFTGFYTAIHVTRGGRKTVASWWPTTLLVPALMLLIPERFAGPGSSGTLIYVMFLKAAFEAGVPMLLEGALIAWLLAAVDTREGRGPVEGLRGRMVAVAIVYTLRAQVAAIGGLIVIPAIWFSVSFAFSDLLAFDGTERAWSRSTALVSGIRGKILKVLALWFMAWNVLAFALMSPFVTPQEAFTGLFVGGDLPPAAEFGATLAHVVTVVICALALRPILREREALFAEREARRAVQAGGEA
jgi:hypothetical protein